MEVWRRFGGLVGKTTPNEIKISGSLERQWLQIPVSTPADCHATTDDMSQTLGTVPFWWDCGELQLTKIIAFQNVRMSGLLSKEGVLLCILPLPSARGLICAAAFLSCRSLATVVDLGYGFGVNCLLLTLTTAAIDSLFNLGFVCCSS